MENINKKNYVVLIEGWKNSGQTQKEFCKIHQLAYSGFHYWYKKYKQGQTVSDTDFLSVSLPVSSGTPTCELCLPDGRRLCFYQPVTVSFLKTLLA